MGRMRIRGIQSRLRISGKNAFCSWPVSSRTSGRTSTLAGVWR